MTDSAGSLVKLKNFFNNGFQGGTADQFLIVGIQVNRGSQMSTGALERQSVQRNTVIAGKGTENKVKFFAKGSLQVLKQAF